MVWVAIIMLIYPGKAEAKQPVTKATAAYPPAAPNTTGVFWLPLEAARKCRGVLPAATLSAEGAGRSTCFAELEAVRAADSQRLPARSASTNA